MSDSEYLSEMKSRMAIAVGISRKMFLSVMPQGDQDPVTSADLILAFCVGLVTHCTACDMPKDEFTYVKKMLDRLWETANEC